MKKYAVHLKVYAGMVIEVEAESEEQAREIAENEAEAPCLCWSCSNDLDIGDVGEITEITAIE